MMDSNADLLSPDLLRVGKNQGSYLEDANLFGRLSSSSIASPLVPPLTALATTPAEVDIEVIGATWDDQGPAPATNGQVENVNPNNQVIGAIHTVVAHPTNANILWAGGVNGGIWRTTNGTAASPNWTPLTDEFRGLSIGAMALDPTDTDPEGDGLTIIAGIGHFSSYFRRGGPLTGILRSTNGGNTFTQISPTELQRRNISGVAQRGNTILVSANNFGGGIGGGVYRSIDNGATWNFISGINGLGTGAAFDLVGDSTNNQRFYVSVQGVGIFRSDDNGANWTNVSGGDAALNTAITTTGNNITNNNTEMAVSRVNGRVYVGVLRNGQPVYIGFSDNQGANWTQMDLPVTQESNGDREGLNPREKPGSQGGVHFSIIADPNNQNIVYIGGDRQDGPFPNAILANGFTGRLFRGDTTQTAAAPGSTTNINSPQWQPLTHRQGGFSGGGTANTSSPHADSREMTFDANGDLIEVDDGGVYRRTRPRVERDDPATPQNELGDWFSLNGNLQVTEQHDIAYDTISNILISGNQDTGTMQQVTTGSQTWDSVSVADGGDVAVSVDPGNVAQSVRYSSRQELAGFTRRVYGAANNLISTTSINLTGFDFDTDGTGPDTSDAQFNTPVATNAINPGRLIVGGASNVYESTDQGDNVTVVNVTGGGSVGVNSVDGDPIAYGGRRGGVDNPDVLYIGSGSNVFVRTRAGGTLANTSYTGGLVQGIALDLDDWQTAFAIDNDQVFQTTNAGANWADITGDLSSLLDFTFNGGDFLESIDFVSSPTLDAVVVGTTQGVFASLSNDWDDWFAVGPATLPNAPVWDMDFDRPDNVLVSGTLGRGAWLLGNINNVLNSAPHPDAGSPYSVNEGSSVLLNASGSSDPNGLVLTYLWDLDLDRDGIFGEPGENARLTNNTSASPTFSAAGLDGPDTLAVRLRVTNSQGSSATTTATINILNVAPTVTNLTVNPATITENNTVTLTGTFTDPGLPDSHTVVVNWGDGTSSTLSVNQNQLSRSFQTTHRYLDDNPSTGTPFDILPITVTVVDDDGGIGQGNTFVAINNVAPTITNLALDSTNINETDTIRLSGTFTDPGLPDSHTVVVNWGDGTNSTFFVNQNQFSRSFQIAHQYLDDNPSTGTPFDILPITVTVIDDDTGSTQGNLAIRVNNINPVITSFSTNATFANRIKIGELVTINAAFTDIGILDTHRAFVDWGDGTPTQEVTVAQGSGSGTVQGSHVYAKGGAFTVRLTLRDDDTGEDVEFTTAIIIGIVFGPGGIEDDDMDMNNLTDPIFV